jgi:hypothetical protein
MDLAEKQSQQSDDHTNTSISCTTGSVVRIMGSCESVSNNDGPDDVPSQENTNHSPG